jgi:hypothetical protein
MNRKTLIATAMLAVLSGGLMASGIPLVVAAEKPAATAMTDDADQSAKETKALKEAVKVSEDAAITMRNVHGARLAIFNGLPDKAQTYIDAAVTRIAATSKDADKYATETKQKTKAGDTYVTFDAILAVADDFVPTKENAEHIAQANRHLRRGEKDKALATLKLGEVDVTVSTQLVPVKFAEQQIEDASKLVGAGKYYEANLALKAIEDAVVIDTQVLAEQPKAKDKS